MELQRLETQRMLLMLRRRWKKFAERRVTER
jgi:hypothetical protein